MIRLRNGIVSVLDIGSSKIACLIARVDPVKPPVILGIGHQLSHGVRSGALVDIQQAESAILAAVHAAEKMADIAIEDVVVNISGPGLASHTLSFETDIAGHEVTSADINRLLEQANGYFHPQETYILHSIPYGFVIDNTPGIVNPLGMYGHNLKSQVHVVTAPASTVRNLQHCLAKCSLNCQKVVATGYAAGLAALTPDERQLGSILLDIGGGTTEMAVFEGGNLIYTGSLPIGGIHITKDIARGLSTSISYAERVKNLYGSALATMQDENQTLDIPQEDENAETQNTDMEQEISHIARSALTGIIRPRVEEMFEMVQAHLTQHGFDKISGYRLVLSGGTSQLSGIKELASDLLHAQARLGRPPALEGLAESTKGPGFSATAGLIHYVQHELPSTAYGIGEKEGMIKSPAFIGGLVRWFQQNF